MNFYDEACYLIPQWEDLDENAHNERKISNSFKELFKDTYHYFADFYSVYFNSDIVEAMDIEIFQTYSTMVALLSKLLDEIRYSDSKEDRDIYEIVYSFLEFYIFKSYFHSTFENNTVTIRMDETQEPWHYNVDTYEKTGNVNY